MAKTMAKLSSRRMGGRVASLAARVSRPATTRNTNTRTASTSRSSAATASRRPAPRTVDDDVTYRPTRSSRTARASFEAAPARRPVTSGFDRFATSVTAFDYWTGSEAPDFEYWDNLSQNRFDDWSDFAAAEAAEPQPAPRTTRTAKPASRAAAKPAPAASAAEAFANLYDTAAVATTEMQNRAKMLPSSTIIAIAAAMLVVCFAVLAFVRIDWSSEAVQVKVDSQQLTETITSARAAGRVLEVQKSVASAAQRIRTEAIFLGMVEPEHVESLVLPPDTLTVDEDGHLSLSGSVARVAEKAPTR